MDSRPVNTRSNCWPCTAFAICCATVSASVAGAIYQYSLICPYSQTAAKDRLSGIVAYVDHGEVTVGFLLNVHSTGQGMVVVWVKDVLNVSAVERFIVRCEGYFCSRIRRLTGAKKYLHERGKPF